MPGTNADVAKTNSAKVEVRSYNIAIHIYIYINTPASSIVMYISYMFVYTRTRPPYRHALPCTIVYTRTGEPSFGASVFTSMRVRTHLARVGAEIVCTMARTRSEECWYIGEAALETASTTL